VVVRDELEATEEETIVRWTLLTSSDVILKGKGEAVIITILSEGIFLTASAGKWKIKDHSSSVTIEAGILSQELMVSDSSFAASDLFVGLDNLVWNPGEELSVTFMKAFPNEELRGFGYSETGGVEQTDAVKNQTDALLVQKKENKATTGVYWGDSLYVNQSVFPLVFKEHTCRISEPARGTKRLTLTFFSGNAMDGISVEIKISDLMLESWHLAGKYSHTTLLTPNLRGLDPSVFVFSDSAYSKGVISVSEVPSKLRYLGMDGSSGYNPDLFEWVIGPGESFESDPVFLYAFSGKSYPAVSAVSTALDRCVESDLQDFLKESILRSVKQNKK
jgi:hypothetical protein